MKGMQQTALMMQERPSKAAWTPLSALPLALPSQRLCSQVRLKAASLKNSTDPLQTARLSVCLSVL